MDDKKTSSITLEDANGNRRTYNVTAKEAQDCLNGFIQQIFNPATKSADNKRQLTTKTDYEEEQERNWENYSSAVYHPLFNAGVAVVSNSGQATSDIALNFVKSRDMNADLHSVMVSDFANLAQNAVDLYSRHLATILELTAYQRMGAEVSSRKQMYKLIGDHSE